MEDYFQRWLEVKTIVESRADILRKLAGIDKDFFDAESIIGQGDNTTISRVGNIELKDRKLDLAIRVGRIKSLRYALTQVSAFHNAFERGNSVPYFNGIVQNGNKYFILTEDLTEGGVYRINNELGQYQNRSDGKTFFIDPKPFSEIDERLKALYKNQILTVSCVFLERYNN